MNRVAVTIALLLLGLLVLAPFLSLAGQSLRVDFVETVGGARIEGFVRNSDPKGVTIRAMGEQVSRFVERKEVAGEGRCFSLGNYREVLGGAGEQNMLLATLALAGASTLVALLLGLPLGILFGATDLPGRRLLETLSVLPLVLPPILLAIATYHDLVGFQPSFLRAVIVFGLSLFPLVSLFVARALRAIDAGSLEAALAQAPRRTVLVKVLLPLALPGAAAGALLVFVFVVSDFAVPDFLGVTTAKNTIVVYANAVYRYWSTDGDIGKATASGMPATLLALVAFLVVLRVEVRRSAATLTGAFREPQPLPLGKGGRGVALALVLAVLGLGLLWPAWRHAESAAGKYLGNPVNLQGVGGQSSSADDDPHAKPAGLLDGLSRGLKHDRVGGSALTSLGLAAGGALLAVLMALLLTEAGRGRPRLDRFLLVASFLPVAVPPMALAVGWVSFFGPEFAGKPAAPVALLGARLLPFATFAVRAARNRVGAGLVEAAAVAGLSPARRLVFVVFPLVAPGAGLGFLLAFLFGLREVDAIIFTRSGAETLPVQLYNMIHYGFDIQVAALSLLWMAGIAAFLLGLRFLVGPRFRLMP